MTQQLRLVADDTAHTRDVQNGPVERIFAHWVFMMGRNPRRCALGPTRRKLIANALKLYDEATLALAIDGCAASPYHAGENERETEYRDLALILRNEDYVERFAAMGERLHAQVAAARAAQRRAAAEPAHASGSTETAEQVARNRELVRQFAARRAGRAA